MRDRRARLVVAGLILIFPVLMVGASPRRSLTRPTVATVFGLEVVLGVGLVAAGLERRRLLAERAEPVPLLTTSLPQVVPTERAEPRAFARRHGEAGSLQ